MRRRIAKQILETSKLSGHFELRSGVASDTYFDKYLFESDPKLIRSIAELMTDLLPEGTEIIAGLEMGGIPIVTVLSQITGLPAAFIRKDAKPYGTQKYAEGAALKEKGVTVIEDVVSSGGAILDALSKLKADGIIPLVAICIIDRETGGYEALQKVGLELRSVFKMSEIERSV